MFTVIVYCYCLQVLEDSLVIDQFQPYQWKDWFVIRSTDCYFIWNTSIAIELSAVSNGWFRYLLDNKLATMYSSGSIESGPDPFEGRDELVDKIRRSCVLVSDGTPVVPILSSTSNVKLVVGNWTMVHKREGEVDIFNAEGTQVCVHEVGISSCHYHSFILPFSANHDAT